MKYCIYVHGILCILYKKPNAAALDFLFNIDKYRIVNVQNAQILTLFFVQSA